MRFLFFNHRFPRWSRDGWIRWIPAAAVLALQLGIFAVPAHPAGRFRVLEVVSGDTVRVEDSRSVLSVRLVGIDAPEMPDGTSPGQRFNEESRRYLSRMIFQKDVEVVSFGYDIELNVLGLVRSDGKDIGIELVRAGLAEVDPVKAPPGFDLRPLQGAEKEARLKEKGIWSVGVEYVSPRKWRKQHAPSFGLAAVPESKEVVKPRSAGKQRLGTDPLPEAGAPAQERPGEGSPAPEADTRTGKDRKTVVHGIDVEIGALTEKLRVSMDGLSVPRAFDIDGNQPRVVVDILNVSEWKGRTRIPVNGNFIRQIRTYLHKESGKFRIVLDLKLDPSNDYLIDQYYDVKKSMYWLEIRK